MAEDVSHDTARDLSAGLPSAAPDGSRLSASATVGPAAPSAPATAPATASVDVERTLVSHGALIAGIDEVGRGALAGPVCVGVVVIAPHESSDVPRGLTDSKLLSATQREHFVALIGDWSIAAEVGFASAAEVDAIGIVAAMRRAAERAFARLPAVAGALLDGSHNWLLRPPAQLLPDPSEFSDPHPDHDQLVRPAPGARTMVKADVSCASVAAASVLAKVRRDAYMRAASDRHPHYGWDSNKGYAAPAHRDAILIHGTTDEHRRSWALLPAASADS